MLNYMLNAQGGFTPAAVAQKMNKGFTDFLSSRNDTKHWYERRKTVPVLPNSHCAYSDNDNYLFWGYRVQGSYERRA